MKTKLHHSFLVLALLVTPVGAQSPTLGITNDSTLGLSVFWPITNGGYSLQWTISLGTSNAWQPYPTQPSPSGDGNNWVVSLSLLQANPHAFFQLSSNIVVVPGAPSVVTVQAYPLTATTSTELYGTVLPNGFDTTWWFQWGPTTSYGNSTSAGVVAGSNTAPVEVVVPLAGLSPGTTYHFQLYGSNSDGISSGGDLAFTTATPLPDALVETYPASNITSSTAQLNGSIDPNGSTWVGWFEWGTTTSYGNRTLDFPGGPPNFQFVGESDVISGLAAHTTYHYRVVAYNGGPDEAQGNDVMFTTSTSNQQQPPTVTTQAASSISGGSATLNSSVNPNGADTQCYFEYGTNSGYGYVTPNPASDIGSGNSAQSFPSGIGNLLPSTVYHYRIVAYNSGGTSDGMDETFTNNFNSQQPPSVDVSAATSVNTTTETLMGYVNPNGATTTAAFFYGTNSSYGMTTGTFSVGNDASFHSVQTNLTGLTPGTTYHFALSATNSGGTTTSADVVFTTATTRPLGIDVSSYQDAINWTSVQVYGVTFAFAKANEGITLTDPTFTSNITHAKAAGLLVGAYHFAHPELHLGTAGADACAAQFWNVAGSYILADGKSLMPVLDYETDPGSNYTQATSSEWVNEWCQDVVNFGMSNGVALLPIVYTYNTFATEWLNGSVTQWPVWIGNPNSGSPQTGAPYNDVPWATWNFWQYNQNGSVAGVPDAVDLDVFHVTATNSLQDYIVASP